MLIQQDRFIRLAEQLGRLFAGILGRRAAETETIRTEMDALAEQAGLDLGLAMRLTPESLELLVSPGGEPDPTRAWLLAELFHLAAWLEERDGDPQSARESDVRALRLYRRVDPDRLPEADLPDIDKRIREIETRLEGR